MVERAPARGSDSNRSCQYPALEEGGTRRVRGRRSCDGGRGIARRRPDRMGRLGHLRRHARRDRHDDDQSRPDARDAGRTAFRRTAFGWSVLGDVRRWRRDLVRGQSVERLERFELLERPVRSDDDRRRDAVRPTRRPQGRARPRSRRRRRRRERRARAPPAPPTPTRPGRRTPTSRSGRVRAATTAGRPRATAMQRRQRAARREERLRPPAARARMPMRAPHSREPRTRMSTFASTAPATSVRPHSRTPRRPRRARPATRTPRRHRPRPAT